MNTDQIEQAAQLFANARRTGRNMDPLADALLPKSFSDGHAIQDATVRLLGEAIGGWKVGFDKTGEITRAPIFKDVIFQSGASIPRSRIPLGGIEAEIAFRFLRDMPARSTDYTRVEVEDAVECFAAIELLNSRYAEPVKRSQLEKLADCITQGGLVCASPRPDWRSVDFSKLEIVLTVDGKEIVRNTGSHPTGDPVPPMVALVNAVQKTQPIKAGQVVTTGTWSGVNYVGPTSEVTAQFAGFAPATYMFI